MKKNAENRETRRGGVGWLREKERLAVSVLLVAGVSAALLTLPKSLQAASQNLVAQGCKVSQTITYARCGHQVLRRMDAESAWLGRSREGVEKLLLPGEKLTSFSSRAISMQSTLDLFCPDHTVLMLDERGEACLWENRYGFAMERVAALGFSAPDEESRARWVQGVPYESREAAMAEAEEIRAAF